MKKMELAKTRIEALKQEALAAVASGKFSKEPADEMGVTPQQRLEWTAPSCDYILGVAANLPENDIEAALNSITGSDVMLAFVATVEVLSGDQYVTEGKGNLKKALSILKDAKVPERNSPVEDEEPQSVAGRIMSVLTKDLGKKRRKKAKTETVPVPDVRLEKPESLENPEVKALKAKINDLEEQLTVMRKRAMKAETQVNELKFKYESPLKDVRGV